MANETGNSFQCDKFGIGYKRTRQVLTQHADQNNFIQNAGGQILKENVEGLLPLCRYFNIIPFYSISK